ncbi:MAG: protein-disulfide reductase DsbD domain-containing protein [Bacteroidia bacterium]
MLIKRLLFILINLFASSGFAQPGALNPVKWEMSWEELSETEGNLVFTATMDPKWHIYSQKQSGDGPIPTSFSLLITPEWEPVGTVQEPEPENVYTEVFQSNVLMFSNQAVFKQKIKRKNKKEFFVLGDLEFMSCNDVSCLPPRIIKINLKVNGAKSGVKLKEVKD